MLKTFKTRQIMLVQTMWIHSRVAPTMWKIYAPLMWACLHAACLKRFKKANTSGYLKLSLTIFKTQKGSTFQLSDVRMSILKKSPDKAMFGTDRRKNKNDHPKMTGIDFRMMPTKS